MADCRHISVSFFPLHLDCRVDVSIPSPTYGQVKRAVGARLHLRPSSLNIFGIFLGPLSSPTSLCEDNDSVSENVSKVCLRRLSFACDREKKYLEEDVAATILIFWEVIHEHDTKRILPPWSRVEEKVLKKEMLKGWVVPDYGGVVWPTVESMREYLRFVRMKRSSYYSSCFFKVESCLVKFSEPIFAGVLPGVGNGEGKLLNVAVTLSGIVFLSDSGQKLCEVPWCTVSRLKMNAETNFFTIDIPAMDDYGITHSVNIPVEANGVEYLFSLSRHVIRIHEKVMGMIDLRCPRPLTEDEYSLLNLVKPEDVCTEYFATWVLPQPFHPFLTGARSNTDRIQGCVKLEGERSNPTIIAKRKALHFRKKHRRKALHCESSQKLLASDQAIRSVGAVASCLVSSLDDPCKRHFAVAYFSNLNCLNSLLRDYSQRVSARSMVRNASHVMNSASSKTNCTLGNATSSQVTSGVSLISEESVINWEDPVAEESGDLHPAQVKSARNGCYTGVILFKIDYAEALDLAEKSIEKFSLDTSTISTSEGKHRAITGGEEGAVVTGRGSKVKGELKSVSNGIGKSKGDITCSSGLPVFDKDSSTDVVSCTEDASSEVAAKKATAENESEFSGEKGCESDAKVRHHTVAASGPMGNREESSGGCRRHKDVNRGKGHSSGATSRCHKTSNSSKSMSHSSKGNSVVVDGRMPSVREVLSEDEMESLDNTESPDEVESSDEVQSARKKKSLSSSTSNEFASMSEDELAFEGGSNTSSAVDLTPLPQANRIVTVKAFGRRSFDIPFLGGDALVGTVKEFVAYKCLHLKKSSFGIFGIFMPPLGSPGAFFSDKSTFPSSVQRVCFQRVSFNKSVEHAVIRSDMQAVQLLYSEAKYVFRRGSILPRLSEVEAAHLEVLIERKSKLAFVKRISGFNIGTKRFPMVSPVAEYWWNFFYRAEFCCLRLPHLVQPGPSVLSKGDVLHLAVSLDQVSLMSMDDKVMASWPMDCIHGVFMQNSELCQFIVLEVILDEKDRPTPDDAIFHLPLETNLNEYIFSLLEHVFRLRVAQSCRSGARNIAEDDVLDRKITNHRYSSALPTQLTKMDPVFRIVNITARCPLKDEEKMRHLCQLAELITVLDALRGI